MTPPNRGQCCHVFLLANGGKSVENFTSLNASLGRHGTHVKTSKRYLLTTAYDPTRCSLTCKDVKPIDGHRENQDQFKNITAMKTTTAADTRTGPVGLQGKTALKGSDLDRSLGFIERIPQKSSMTSRESHCDASWQDAPVRESRPVPSRDYLPATPQPSKAIPDRTRARLDRKKLATKKRAARAKQVFKNAQKEMLKFKVKCLCSEALKPTGMPSTSF